jgi:hypothetical protein
MEAEHRAAQAREMREQAEAQVRAERRWLHGRLLAVADADVIADRIARSLRQGRE